jgi:7-carboxy-7-deazaguanine synthase
MVENQLQINEIFLSIQGESSKAGLPCVFVRLCGCSLRCRYCDTSYAFREGEALSIECIIAKVQTFNCPLVEITGGEPLIQPRIFELMERLCDLGFDVLVETSGQISIADCDPRVVRIVDIKTPNSGAADSFLESNVRELTDVDEVKFVITNREDFDWAVQLVRDNGICDVVNAVHFSPVMFQDGNDCIDGCEALSPEVLAQWILDSEENIRLHLQLHRYIWAPNARGV